MYNRQTIEAIVNSHILRENTFREIVQGIPVTLDFEKIKKFQTQKELGLSSRVPNDEIRSLKNIVLSFNTLFSFAAEMGGLPAISGHYMAEKFAMMIETAGTIDEILDIEFKYIQYYSNPKHRIKKEAETISQKVLNYIDMTFMHELNIEIISNKIHVNASHMMRKFKEQTGETISYAINNKRISEACDMLENTNISISDISFMVGYNSVQYFGRIFKKMTGETPSNYKKIQNNI